MSTVNNLTSWRPGQSGNPNGRPKGAKSLSTLVRELLEDPNFDWNLLPLKKNKRLVKQSRIPWRAIVVVALQMALDKDIRAMEFLRKSAYGNRTDVINDKRTIQAPLIVSNIKPRHTTLKG